MYIEPSNPNDATIRIFTAKYDFVKTCLRVDVNIHRHSQNSSVIRLNPGSFSTKLFMLLRPMFVRGPMSKPYTLEMPELYDSSSSRQIVISLKEVTNDVILGREDNAYVSISNFLMGQRQNALHNNQAYVRCPMSMYYLNYVGEIVNTNFTNVATFVIMGTNPPNKNKWSVVNSMLQLMYDGEYMNVQTNRMRAQVSLSRKGLIIVTYVHNLLLITNLDEAGKVEMLRSTNNAIFFARKGDVLRISAETKFPKKIMYPYTPFSIPNLADIALRLRMI